MDTHSLQRAQSSRGGCILRCSGSLFLILLAISYFFYYANIQKRQETFRSLAQLKRFVLAQFADWNDHIYDS